VEATGPYGTRTTQTGTHSWGRVAGLTVAMELEKKLVRDAAIEITLFNHANFFLFTPMLHEVAT
jgi:hypothetical protein